MMHRTYKPDEFKVGIVAGTMLVFAQLTLLLGNVATKQQLYTQVEEQKALMNANAAIAQTRITQGLKPSPAGIQLNGYSLSKTPPNTLDFLPLADPQIRVLIYDQFGQCTGDAYQGSFSFVIDNPNACKGN